MAELTITVHGTPAPQGSKRHVGGGRMIEMSKRVKPWRLAVEHAAEEAMATSAGSYKCTGDGHLAIPGYPLEGPLAVRVTFALARPKGHYGTGRNAAVLKPSAPAWPATMPDIDKLLRSTFDALTMVRAWRDDGQVARVTTAKIYAARDDIPGAVITIREMEQHPQCAST